jgi:MFS transporter, DHA1 family, multidrug resistance protein
MINGVMPLCAPSIGVIVLALTGWRSIYGLMAAWGLMLFFSVRFGLAESIRRKNPNALAPRQLFASYREVICHPVCRAATLINAFCFGTMFAFISGSPILFMQEMHLSADAFGVLFSLTVAGSMGGTFAANLLHRGGMQIRRVLAIGLVAMLTATLVLLVLSGLRLYGALPMAGLICLSNFGMGMVGPNASYSAMQVMPHLAGPTSAVLSSTQMVVAAGSAALMSALFSVLGPTAMATAMFGFAALASLTFFTGPKVTAHGTPTAHR